MEINLEHVTFAYGTQDVFKDLNYRIDTNKVVGLTGANGSGKTTLGKLIMGMISHKQGSITIDNQKVESIPLWEIGKKIGYLFQNPCKQLFAATVLDELLFPFKLRNVVEVGLKDKCLELLQEFNLKHKAQDSPFILSMGEKQRLALAAILINQPQYLILDEPTTGLDEKNKNILLELLRTQKENGIGMMIISHDKAFVSAICDEVYKVDQCKVEEITYDIRSQN